MAEVYEIAWPSSTADLIEVLWRVLFHKSWGLCPLGTWIDALLVQNTRTGPVVTRMDIAGRDTNLGLRHLMLILIICNLLLIFQICPLQRLSFFRSGPPRVHQDCKVHIVWSLCRRWSSVGKAMEILFEALTRYMSTEKIVRRG